MDLTLLNALSHLEKPDGLIALPGPEGYILAVRPDRPTALERLARLKGRTEPLLLLGWDLPAFTPFIGPLPPKATALIKRHWPAPLILLLDQPQPSPETFSAWGPLKILQPDSALLMDLLSLNPTGLLVTLGAGRGTDLPAREAAAVYNTFGDDVDFVVHGDAEVLESVAPTVVRVKSNDEIQLLRSGAIVLD
ncbi:L-threonylcarbamoyladenylate synthase [Vampirovibrio chlorellavorus]|uniref:L-threonylcarbamoyladenylate synthase n=1 Tax=Vampirovibrio chlorellavorus TaxID=758823 RepID=UPI0026EC3DB0|nr:Sua5/YciO/YrdC/YwlC family protein [Vampirovibrio chlorellavorus]